MKTKSITTTKPKASSKSITTTHEKRYGFKKMKGIYEGLIEETEDCWNLGK